MERALADIAYPLGAAPELLEDDGVRMPCGDCHSTGPVCPRCRRQIEAAARRVRLGIPIARQPAQESLL